jgi:hypothetical protein
VNKITPLYVLKDMVSCIPENMRKPLYLFLLGFFWVAGIAGIFVYGPEITSNQEKTFWGSMMFFALSLTFVGGISFVGHGVINVLEYFLKKRLDSKKDETQEH